jgi:hypothetical protein
VVGVGDDDDDDEEEEDDRTMTMEGVVATGFFD